MSDFDQSTTEKVRAVATPKAEPQRTMTSFSASLRCMDSLFERYFVPTVSLAIQQVEEIADNRSGIKDMFITAVSSMAVRSEAISVSFYGQDMPDLSVHNQLIHQSPVIDPVEYVVRISSPLVDDGTVTMQRSIGLQYNGTDFTVGDETAENDGAAEVRVETLGASNSSDRLLSIVSLDMNLASAVNARIVPGVFSSNSIAVSRTGRATDVSASFEKFGALFDMSFDNSEGMHHTLRTLVELGAVELMGKLTQVPYWECLSLSATRPEVRELLFDWYKKSSEKELINVAQRALSEQGLYAGEVDGEMSADLQRSIINYKRAQRLLVNRFIDFDFYASLLGSQATHRLPEYEPKAQSHVDDDRRPEALPRFEFSLQPQKRQPEYLVNERVPVMLSLSEKAYVACYHQDGAQRISLIYPVGEVDYRLEKDTTVDITAAVQMALTQVPGEHQLMCVVSQDELHQRVLALPADTVIASLESGSLVQMYALYKSISENNRDFTLPLVQFYNYSVKPLQIHYREHGGELVDHAGAQVQVQGQ